MKSNIFSALSEKSFVYVWLGEIFALIANNIFNFFLLLIVYDITHSNTANSAVVLSITIPSIFFGALAGVYADRWNKKKVLLIVNFSRALLLILLAFNVRNLYFIYSISFVFSFITQFFIPAEMPIVPLVTEPKNLYSGNALFGLAIYGSMLVAYILAGPLIIYLKPFGVSLVISLMLIIASLFIFFVRLKNPKEPKLDKRNEESNILKDMKSTLSIISHTKDISQSIFFLALIQTLILVIATIAPGYASSVLGVPIEQFPLLFVAPAALGVVIGAWLIINYFAQKPKNTIITIGIFLASIAMMLLRYGSRVASRGFVYYLNLYLPHFLTIDIIHIVIFLAFILGLSNSLIFVPANTILQEETSDEFRGKVYGLLNAFVGVLSLLPIIIVGGLADIIGVGAVIFGIGIFLFILGFLRIVLR